MDESRQNHNPEEIPTTPDYAALIGLILATPTRWAPLPASWRVGVTRTAALWYLGGDMDPEGDPVTVLALAWTHPAARPVILQTLPEFTSRRETDALERLLLTRYHDMRGTYSYLPDLDPDGYTLPEDPDGPGFAPLPVALADVMDVPEPEPVIWHEAPGPVGAVLSVGEVALLSGEGGQGKSFVTLALAAAGALAADRGEPWGAACGLRIVPGPAVLVSYEDSPARMAGRLRRMERDGAAPYLRTFHRPVPLWVTDRAGPSRRSPWWADLWRFVADVGARLVVIDPATSALPDAGAGESGPVRAFLQGLTMEAERHGCGVLVVTHSTKAARNATRAGEDPGAGIVAGSAAWYDGARGVLALTSPPDRPGVSVLACVKSNYGRKGWGTVLHDATTDAGEFAGLVFLNGPGDRLEDVRDRTGNGHNGAGRNRPDPGTDFPYGANANAGDL